MNICVFCSASEVDEKYQAAAREFAELIGRHGHILVWGGTNRGLMNIVASSVREAGGKIIGVGVELLRDRLFADPDEQIIAKDLGARKAAMLERADAIIMMVGGLGTLDEVTEIIELKKHKVHDKPVIILNTNRFYEGLKIQLEKMNAEGLLPRPMEEMIYFADTPDEAMSYIEAHGN